MPTTEQLARFALFADANDTVLSQLVSAVEEMSFTAGSVIFAEGDEATALYLVVHGSIQASKQNSAGSDVVIHELGPGDFAGVTGLFIDKPRSATLTTLDDSILWKIDKQAIHQLLHAHADLATSLIRYLSLRYRRDASSIAEVPTHSDAPQAALHMAFFDAKPYDQVSFGEQVDPDHEIHYIEARLGPQTAALAKGCKVVVAFVNDVIDAATIQILVEQGVELLAMRCAGFNNVDLVAARKAGLRVTRVPAYSPHAVAEHALGLLLAINRKINRAWSRVRDGNFQLSGLVGFDLHGRTLGVMGTGKIGKCMARIGRGLGMEVFGWDAFPDQAFADEIGMQYVAKEELFAKSKVVSLHTPLLPDTHHIIDEQAISLMQPGAVLINTSRGGLVDTKALIQGITSGHLAGAGLDVYEEEGDYFFEDHSAEPIQDSVLSRLIGLPNVIVTSHQAFLTEDALHNIAETTLASVQQYLRGETLMNEVTPA